MKSKSAIILLSGGLDCTSALALALKSVNVKLALTFDYGQDAFEQEFFAAQKIAQHYEIEHKVIHLDWLKNITKTSIPTVTKENLNDFDFLKQSCEKVWVPNRNSLFINIAACFADTKESEFDKIIIGANREEAQTFSDNSKEFLDAINKMLMFSTNSKVQVMAPCVDMDKKEIVKIGVKNNAPLEFVYSCYRGSEKHCGICESCARLRNAIEILDSDTKKTLMLKYF